MCVLTIMNRSWLCNKSYWLHP